MGNHSPACVCPECCPEDLEMPNQGPTNGSLWTPTPWYWSSGVNKRAACIHDQPRTMAIDCLFPGKSVAECQANADRIVTCVNGLAHDGDVALLCLTVSAMAARLKEQGITVAGWKSDLAAVRALVGEKLA